jgi:hypothetical protein
MAMWENLKRVEAAIKRLSREIEQMNELFYPEDTEERHLYAGMLERKRDDVVRGFVIQIHTAIEDILDQLITFAVTGSTRSHCRLRSQSARALRGLLTGGESIGFHRKLSLALALRVITKSTKDRLHVLNNLRNKCSHNWILKIPVRYGKRPAQKKPPLLMYEGRDLHSIDGLKDFLKEYGAGIYLKLFIKYLDLK